MWRETTKHHRNMSIWHEELDGFVPARVLDFHVHIANRGVIPDGQTFQAGGPSIRQYTYEELDQDLAEIYPGRETSAVCFGLPEVGYDQRANDAYISEGSDNERFFGLRLLDPLVDTPEVLEADLACRNFLGVKPYPSYTRKPTLDDATIPDMLPDWAMEIIDRLGLIVMLHIPRRLRLADPLNQTHLAELCARYPSARIVLAHIGRAYFLKCAIGQFERLKELPNLYYDLAMVQHWEVMEYTFESVGAGKVLYGTDIPIALAPGKSVEINHQYTYVTPEPWDLSISDDHGKIQFTSFLYEELRAFKRSAARIGLSRRDVESIFYDNGMTLLDEAIRRKARSSAAANPARR